MLRSGGRKASAGLLLLALTLGGCTYGFAGGGLPPAVRSVAIIPFDNQTSFSGLTQEILARLSREMRARLGLREAGEAQADAIVRGIITRYEPDIPIAFSADRTQSVSARRKLLIVVDIEIYDQAAGRVLWERKGMSVEGEYAERAEAEGRRQAIEKLVNDVIEGAQSQCDAAGKWVWRLPHVHRTGGGRCRLRPAGGEGVLSCVRIRGRDAPGHSPFHGPG